MRLRLKNFRCYIEKEFDFGEEGLLLLSGQSGTGKTSLLMAISFVLYGKGTKLVTVGKTSCSVELEFLNFLVKRSKRPNCLKLTDLSTNEEYEDDSAQGIINERFGTAFDVTSYVQQNATNSFILMTPIEKLSFLEKFAFQGIDLTRLKARCTAIAKKRNEELIATSSQLEMATTHLETMIRPEKVAFPIKTKNKELAIKNEEIRLKNTRTLIKRAEKKIESLSQELAELKVFNAKLEEKTSLLSSLTSKLEKVKEEKGSISYEGDEELEEQEKNLASFLLLREFTLLKEKYAQDLKRLEEMRENEEEDAEKEREKIDSALWKEYTLEGVTEALEEFQQVLKDSRRLDTLKSSFTKVDLEKHEENKKTLQKSKIDLEKKKELLSKVILQKEKLVCPSCNASLRFQEDALQPFEDEFESEVDPDELKKEISSLKKIVSSLEYTVPEEANRILKMREIEKEIKAIESAYEEIPSIREAESNIEYLKEYKRSQQELEKKKEKLKEEKLSVSFTTFQEQINKQKEKLEKMEKAQRKEKKDKKDKKTDEESLRLQIQTQKQNKEKLASVEKQILVLQSERTLVEEAIENMRKDYLSRFSSLGDSEDIQKDLEVEKETLEELRKKLLSHEEICRKIEAWKKYKEELERYKEWETKVASLTEEEKKNRQKYSASMLFKDKILEAESLAIQNVIQSINAHAQEYLDLFFPDNPIVVRLLPFKTTKKNTSKPQINIEIDYKGMEADINMLSGGEMSRVVLAYTLALGEIFNTPLFLLDECTASLDQELTSTVMEGIKTHFSNKLVICICHQVVAGSFDRQLAL